jgi:hypothetical protein
MVPQPCHLLPPPAFFYLFIFSRSFGGVLAWQRVTFITCMALNSLISADVPLRNQSINQSQCVQTRVGVLYDHPTNDDDYY